MIGPRGRRPAALAAALFVLIGTARCTRDAGPASSSREDSNLRVGISNLPSQSADRGVQQFVSNISNEGLLRVNQEGKLEPWLADSWERSTDGLRLTVRLRPNVKFHDGSPVNAAGVVAFLKDNLPKALKAAFDDVESIAAGGEREIEIRFRRPSSLIADSFIDLPILKAGAHNVGTGAFVASGPASLAPGGAVEVSAFDSYYLEAPKLRKIAISTYPNGRAAWAAMLRDQIDMLYEADADAIEAMKGARNVTVYTFDRPYQYVVFLNPRNSKLKSNQIRQALNEAIDRQALVRDALRGHGSPSTGPVSSKHWAYRTTGGTFTYQPREAAAKLAKPMSLRLVTLADAPFDRLGLVVKQQLKAVGVDLEIEEAPLEEIFSRLTKSDFEAVLLDSAMGWSLLRAYRWWHSQGATNVTGFSSKPVDAALDKIRHAVTDDDYRDGVTAFQQAAADDPPAIFLAWSERSRAVGKKFDVQPEPGRDVLASLRLWHRAADKVRATQN